MSGRDGRGRQPVLEYRRAFLEEAPLLREEERKACEIDLLVVRLHLSEVGVERQVEVEIRGEAVFDVEPGLLHSAFEAFVAGARCVELVRVPSSPEHVRREVEGVRRLDLVQLDLPHLRGLAEAVHTPPGRDRGVDHSLVLPSDVSKH